VALSRMELLQRAWPDNIDNPRTVDTHILSLRKKIELDPQQPQLIQTVRNVGYRLNLEFLTTGSKSSRVWSESQAPEDSSTVAHEERRFGYREDASPKASLA
jgi:two-component system, OmpR family, response regulator